MRWFLISLMLLQYRPALPGYTYQFPRDHGSHSEYKLEWWYYTGHLQDDKKREFGYELTFFRVGADSRIESVSAWTANDLYMAHFAITDAEGGRFIYEEKLNRAGPGIAGTSTEGLNVWNENWSARAQGGGMSLRAKGKTMAIDLLLRDADPVIHGNDGLSRKSAGEGHASHYYSVPRMATSGTVEVGGVVFSVTGDSWMDHEFGTNQLGENQVGWDWFGLQLDNGTSLMLYRMRNRDGSLDPYSSGTIMDGHTRLLDSRGFSATPLRTWTSENTGSTYPVEWTVSIPSQDCELRVTPVMDNQELITTRSTGIAYWEGSVHVSGTWQGKPVTGRGYLELTGYLEKYRPRV